MPWQGCLGDKGRRKQACRSDRHLSQGAGLPRACTELTPGHAEQTPVNMKGVLGEAGVPGEKWSGQPAIVPGPKVCMLHQWILLHGEALHPALPCTCRVTLLA